MKYFRLIEIQAELANRGIHFALSHERLPGEPVGSSDHRWALRLNGGAVVAEGKTLAELEQAVIGWWDKNNE